MPNEMLCERDPDEEILAGREPANDVPAQGDANGLNALRRLGRL